MDIPYLGFGEVLFGMCRQFERNERMAALLKSYFNIPSRRVHISMLQLLGRRHF